MRLSYRTLHELSLSGDESAQEAKKEWFSLSEHAYVEASGIASWWNKYTNSIVTYLTWKDTDVI